MKTKTKTVFYSRLLRLTALTPVALLSLFLLIVGCKKADEADRKERTETLTGDTTQVKQEDYSPISPDVEFTFSDTFSKGETLGGKLRQAGADPGNALAIGTLLNIVHSIRTISAGSRIQACVTDSGLIRMVLTPPRSLVAYRVDRVKPGAFKVFVDSLEVERRLIRREGVIENTFYDAFVNNGGSPELAVKYIEIFQFVIYFSAETRKGDSFSLIAEELVLDGEVLGYGRIFVAQYVNHGQIYTAVWRPDPNSEFGGDYFDGEGVCFRRDLLRAPFQAARLTSTFGLRKHPISGDVRMHKGVDFAARPGTPVVASGSGTITRLVRGDTGLGNWIEITHGKSGFRTRYGHMQALARGLRQGDTVKQGQVIGYVGQSGYATGPHLHYEVFRDAKNINPLKVKGSPVQQLTGAELERFLAERYRPWVERLENRNFVSIDNGSDGN